MSQRHSHRTPEISSWQQAQQWLYDRIDYERVGPSGQSNPFRLDRLRQMLRLIGNPQERIPAIHIAGTKGKGSTAAMLDSILRHAGIRTGLYTSPHIVRFEERLRVNGAMPHPEQFTQLVRQLVQTLDRHAAELHDRPPTFFEVATLLGWMYFAQQQAQLVVLETGLGGRLDCTNVCCPLVTIITSIGLDHTHILGNTLEQIAGEKAGILKPGVPLVQGRLPDSAARVVADRARETGCRLLVHGRDFWSVPEPVPQSQGGQPPQSTLPAPPSGTLFRVVTPTQELPGLTLPLDGEHQVHNAALAVMAATLLQETGWSTITHDAVRRGLQTVHWPLRFEVISGRPDIVLDAAHNPDSVAAVVQVLRQPRWQQRRRVLVFAASADKDARTMLSLLLPAFDQIVLTRFVGNPRSLPPEELQELSVALSGGYSEPASSAGWAAQTRAAPQVRTAADPETALQIARELAGCEGMICVTGSIFLAAEARSLLLGHTSPFAVET